MAYSYEKSFTNGLFFMTFLAHWLHAFGIRGRLFFQTDWGEEFGGKSLKKLARLQSDIFDPLGVTRLMIPKGRKEYNGYVERSHRTDDEEFYIPTATKIANQDNFQYHALRWLSFYNTKRGHHGRFMEGMTPWQKLRSLIPELSPHIALFPPLTLDDISVQFRPRGGNDVPVQYQKQSELCCYETWVTFSGGRSRQKSGLSP